MNWTQLNHYTWLLVDSTGKILDRVVRGVEFTYAVGSTGDKYLTLEQAQRAAKAMVTP